MLNIEYLIFILLSIHNEIQMMIIIMMIITAAIITMMMIFILVLIHLLIKR
ncbi:hypothetical protein PFTANZ_03371 [Plasmodium falciparum Tanzania (2000708)]|uniref:Uncharacterized protein n=1 Tax=Plasmodium falciparum Tanzania (2000708) TaxID=1036725 RepID=A0A024W5X1_PLAFA|nr:hypothetical protein PFTANZ_03371 [Plasmodium falciparum Tanzania (2000708)]